MVVTIIVFVLIFGVVVIAHELGHFLIAKLNGIKVLQFSIGMGPDIIKFTKGETKYVLKLLPIGGACMFEGEDGIYSTAPEGEEKEGQKPEGAFHEANVWSRIATVFAGPFFNFILAFVLSLFLIGFAGYDEPFLTRVSPGMPLAEQGFQDGDRVTEINGRHIVVNRELKNYIQFHPLSDQPIELTVERDGQEITKSVTPRLVKDEEGNDVYRLGFSYNIDRTKAGVWENIKYSAYEVKFWIFTTIESLGQMFSGKVSAKEVSGPVGIVQVVGDVVSDSMPGGIGLVMCNILIMGILLTANLGVMNLLPIPALDGGRVFFLLVDQLTLLLAAVGGVGSVISQIGDLAASAVKRNYDIKDYGNLIPGHGGIMDRFDSVIFTAPITYFLIILCI